MHEKFMKMLEKKGPEKMDPSYKASKMEALKDLMGAMKSEMGDRLKKVTVASSDKEGLEQGLDKAKEIVENIPGEEMPESSPEDMQAKEILPEMEAEDELSPEKIDEMIQRLEELKRSKMMS